MLSLTEAIAIGAHDNEAPLSPEGNLLGETIRGHHLIYAGWAMGLGKLGAESPEAFAETFTARVKTWLNSRDPYAYRYAHTTVGVDEEGYKKALGSGLARFVRADDNEDFTVVEEMSDSIICGGMRAYGCHDHCTRRKAESEVRLSLFSKPEVILVPLDETKYMSALLETARQLEIPTTIRYAISDGTDVPIRRVRTVTLKVWQIKAIIQKMANTKEYKPFFKDQFAKFDVTRD